jgi:beta-N-acetylhexosaminidase
MSNRWCGIAGAFNDALREGGVLSCGKHFPGYSRCPEDAHHELPTVDVSLEDLQANELAIFRAFANRVDAMMIGHALYPAIERGAKSSSLSSTVIEGMLRDEMGFRGLVMTDDLDMEQF